MDGLHGPEAAVFERAAEVFSLLSATSRLRILCALCERQMCVPELAKVVELPQPAVTRELSLLFRAGLLARRRVRARVHYTVDAKTKEFLCGAVQAFVH